MAEGGVRGLYAGVVSALVLVCHPVVQFTIFEQLRRLVERRGRRRVTPKDVFVLGALGKLVAIALTYPVTRRMGGLYNGK